jgi:hypothetical protein
MTNMDTPARAHDIGTLEKHETIKQRLFQRRLERVTLSEFLLAASPTSLTSPTPSP